MSFDSILNAFLTSTVVVALFSLIVKTYLTKVIENHFNKKLELFKSQLVVEREAVVAKIKQELVINHEAVVENIKAQLSLEKDIKKTIVENKIEAFRRLNSNAYGLRLECRDFIENIDNVQIAITKLKDQFDIFEKSLRVFKGDLEEAVFHPIHKYKHKVVYFISQAEKLISSKERRDESGSIEIEGELKREYLQIDEDYKMIHSMLSITDMILPTIGKEHENKLLYLNESST